MGFHMTCARGPGSLSFRSLRSALTKQARYYTTVVLLKQENGWDVCNNTTTKWMIARHVQASCGPVNRRWPAWQFETTLGRQSRVLRVNVGQDMPTLTAKDTCPSRANNPFSTQLRPMVFG